jgi:hypothetical protein
VLQTYLVSRDPQSLFYTIIASFLKKSVPNKIKQWFYPIKRISGIVATPVGLSPRRFWSVRHPLYFVIAKCNKSGFYIGRC